MELQSKMKSMMLKVKMFLCLILSMHYNKLFIKEEQVFNLLMKIYIFHLMNILGLSIYI